MRIAWRVVVVVATFVAVGWVVGRGVRRHAAVGTPAAQVQLSAGMAGLFAGGAAAVLVGIGLVGRKR
jgi:hypothetical protein